MNDPKVRPDLQGILKSKLKQKLQDTVKGKLQESAMASKPEFAEWCAWREKPCRSYSWDLSVNFRPVRDDGRTAAANGSIDLSCRSRRVGSERIICCERRVTRRDCWVLPSCCV